MLGIFTRRDFTPQETTAAATSENVPAAAEKAEAHVA
jgi:hypothetical protein